MKPELWYDCPSPKGYTVIVLLSTHGARSIVLVPAMARTIMGYSGMPALMVSHR